MSVVVPTHDPAHLKEAVGSALAQLGPDDEIVVVPNNGARVGDLQLPEDPRIRAVGFDGPPRVGAVKRFAFGAARGGILVELDHDDILLPRALERIRGALSSGSADFAYSNCAGFRDGTWERVEWEPCWGWKVRPVVHSGRMLVQMVAFDPSPASIGHVWWAPNHVRAWTRDAYLKAGGHDESMSVCDDHDLLARTYLTGRMERIDECLYLQRHYEASTTERRNAEIQRGTREVYGRYIERLVLRWASGLGLPCFDLGGAHDPRAGWTAVDLEGAPVAADLRGRWPWAASSVGAFRAHDFLEHLPDKLHTVSEIHRCLAPGGWLLSLTPSALGQGAFQDPTHVSFWVKNSWLYWTHRDWAKYIRNDRVKFRSHRLVECYPTPWHRTENVPYVAFDGVCVKDGYEGPGPHDI